MKKISWWMGALLAFLGLMIFCFPTFWIKLAVIVLGLGAIAYGIYNIVYVKDLFDNTNYKTTLTIKSIASIIIGSLAVFLPLAFAGATWTVMIRILMIYLFVVSITGFVSLALLRDSDIDRKKYIMENIILLLVAVILLLISPENLARGILRVIGLVTFLTGCVIVVLTIKLEKNITEVDATIVDAPETEDKE